MSASQSCLTLHGPRTATCQAPPSMRFSRQEYWSGVPRPSPGVFPTQGSNPGLLHCGPTLYRLSHQGAECIDGWKLFRISSDRCLKVGALRMTQDTALHLVPLRGLDSAPETLASLLFLMGQGCRFRRRTLQARPPPPAAPGAVGTTHHTQGRHKCSALSTLALQKRNRSGEPKKSIMELKAANQAGYRTTSHSLRASPPAPWVPLPPGPGPLGQAPGVSPCTGPRFTDSGVANPSPSCRTGRAWDS